MWVRFLSRVPKMKKKIDYPTEEELFVARLSGAPIDFGYVSSNNRLRLLSYAMKIGMIVKTEYKHNIWNDAKDVYEVIVPLKYRDASCRPDQQILHQQGSFVYIQKARLHLTKKI